MRTLLKVTTLSLVASSLVYAGGYKIPETSLNSVALSAATVAHSTSADAAYYNPANISFMKDENALEMDLMVIKLEATNFRGLGTQSGDDIDAKSETFLIPSINYVSGEVAKDIRLGFSMVVPGGLTKRWEDSPAKDKAEEFTLKVVELNPSISYLVNDKLALAFGFRIVHSEGIVKSSSSASREMVGEGLDYGYNLALAYKPTTELEVGVTYRSQVDLREEGNAKLYIGDSKVYDGGSSVTVPLPASLNIALAYTFENKTTLEFVYERNFWSAYKMLDFNYKSTIPTVLQPTMDAALAKDWRDSSAYRFGITREMDKLTLMSGFVIDKTPVPDSKVSYELPDSDSVSISFGTRYDINKKINKGLGVLYSMRANREVKNDEIEGTFSNSNVIVASAGVGYKF